MEKNVLVGQSGGPTAVINSSLYGVVARALKASENGEECANGCKINKVLGMVNGIEGFLDGHTTEFKDVLPGEKLELLKTTPGSFLGSCRYKLPDDLSDPVYEQLFERFEQLNIGYVFYIGGNDSMDTVSKLSRVAERVGSDIVILGVPKTIDNDLVMTDHTPGFGSAAKYVATTVREIVTDANVYEKPAVTIVEIMGRHAGWLTAASVLARKYDVDNPCLIYLPESNFDLDEFVNKVKKLLQTRNNIVVCVSEGIHDANGKFICEYDSVAGVDTFGHKMLAGCGKYLENYVRSHLGVKARSVEFNVSQRCSAALISGVDQEEAVMAGAFGVEAAMRGETGYMIAFDRKEGADGYEISCSLQDVNKICNEEKKVPAEWITDEGSNISQEFIDYAAPLIKGTVSVPVDEAGLPRFAYRY